MAGGGFSNQNNQRKITQYMKNVCMENLMLCSAQKFQNIVYSRIEISYSFRKYKKTKNLPTCFMRSVCLHTLTREGPVRRKNYSLLYIPIIATQKNWLLNSSKGWANRGITLLWLKKQWYDCFGEVFESFVETARHIFTLLLGNSTSRYLIQK